MDHIEKEYSKFMKNIFSENWKTDLHPTQIREMKIAFYGGVVVGVIDPENRKQKTLKTIRAFIDSLQQ